MTKFASPYIWQPGSVTRTSAGCAALASVNTAIFILPVDETYVLKDVQLHLHMHRVAATYGAIIYAIVPDDMYAAFIAADWGLNTTWTKYNKFIWMKHQLYFGAAATRGRDFTNITLKPSTKRRVEKDFTAVILLYIEDISNVNTQFDEAHKVDYFIKPVSGTA